MAEGADIPLDELFARACELPAGEREAFARSACSGDRELLRELLELLAADAESGPLPREPSPRPASHSGASSSSSRILKRLSSRPSGTERYRILGDRIARGGMGAIFLVWDEDLQRRLAMKVVLGDEATGAPGPAPPDERRVARFLEEAQITGQLDHPGVVPVHELGLDAEGRTYFTMRLVRGRNLQHIFRLVAGGAEGWSVSRALGVLHKVCETVAYAHSRDVVHRDLKPANVMVGRFGEVYVMDWGLARVVGSQQRGQVPEPDAAEPSGPVYGLRGDEQSAPDPLLATQEGQAMGTPAYMPPEQARGQRERVGFAADIYAVGAMLYEVLAGAPPYARPGERQAARVILERVLAGPPEPVGKLAPRHPPELVAICEKAMAREIEERYADMQEMADDLRAFLEGRVVKAWKTGPWIEVRKWVGRNRPLAASLLAALVLLVGGLLAYAVTETRRARAEQWRADEATARVIDARLDSLGPITAALVPALQRWIEQAEELASRRPAYESALVALRESVAAGEPPDPSGALPSSDDARRLLRDQLLAMAATRQAAALADPSLAADARILSELEPVLRQEARFDEDLGDVRHPWLSAAPADQDALDQLTSFVRQLRALAAPHGGGLARGRERLARARALAQDTLHDPRWSDCTRSVADAAACPAYGGAGLVPQLGLVPLRRDPHSGLWEFAHVLSGTEPTIRADGAYELTADSCIVLVLVPGGTARLGAREPAQRSTHGNGIEDCERPLLDVPLAPCFVSKYELTQAQWHRLRGDWPSYTPAGSFPGPGRVSLLHPVELVSVDEARDALVPWSLTLPTEAQWEWCARAGDVSVEQPARYWWGSDPAGIVRLANCRDAAFDARGSDRADAAGSDHCYVHGPVGNFPPNPWGFHEILGNVAEWCLDWRVESFAMNDRVLSIRPGDGLLTPRYFARRVTRGGGYASSAADLRISARPERMPGERGADIGLRPARGLDPFE